MANLRELRKDQFLSQEDLAKMAGTTTSTVNRLENGKQTPRFATIRRLAKALGVNPADIDFPKRL